MALVHFLCPGRTVRWSVAAGCTAIGYGAMVWPRSQLLGRFPFRGDTTAPVVALTFDDGPNEPYTSQIGELLAERGIAATFFQIGRCAERWPASGRRLVAQGHVVGNHSYSHQLWRCLRPAAVRAETARAQQVLAAQLDLRPALYRPPWLFRTPWLFAALRMSGLEPVSGSFGHPWEMFQPTAGRIARRALRQARPGAVLIFHDGAGGRGGDRSRTVAAVEMVVDALAASGYRFATVDALLRLPAYQT